MERLALEKLAGRASAGPTRIADQMPAGNGAARFSAWFAVKITNGAGAYAFAPLGEFAARPGSPQAGPARLVADKPSSAGAVLPSHGGPRPPEKWPRDRDARISAAPPMNAPPIRSNISTSSWPPWTVFRPSH
jgi:hypothetical protein